MGEDHLHVEHTGERGEQRRTAGMDMYDLRFQFLGADDGLEGMDDGFERLLAWCIDVDELDTLPMGKVVVAVTGTSYDGHVIALFDQTGEEFFAMRLDTTHDVGGTGSIWPSVIAHAIKNLWALIEMKEAPKMLEHFGAVSVCVSVVLMVLVLWLIYRECQQRAMGAIGVGADDRIDTDRES